MRLYLELYGMSTINQTWCMIMSDYLCYIATVLVDTSRVNISAIVPILYILTVHVYMCTRVHVYTCTCVHVYMCTCGSRHSVVSVCFRSTLGSRRLASRSVIRNTSMKHRKQSKKKLNFLRHGIVRNYQHHW